MQPKFRRMNFISLAVILISFLSRSLYTSLPLERTDLVNVRYTRVCAGSSVTLDQRSFVTFCVTPIDLLNSFETSKSINKIM